MRIPTENDSRFDLDTSAAEKFLEGKWERLQEMWRLQTQDYSTKYPESAKPDLSASIQEDFRNYMILFIHRAQGGELGEWAVTRYVNLSYEKVKSMRGVMNTEACRRITGSIIGRCIETFVGVFPEFGDCHVEPSALKKFYRFENPPGMARKS